MRQDSPSELQYSIPHEIELLLTNKLDQTDSNTVLNHIKSLESQLIQSQKMECMGLLATGIAHDFNNLLGSILGYASLLRSKLDHNTDTYEYAKTIETATQRGAEITRQLLDASRPEPFRPTLISVNEIIEEVRNILLHTLPKEIEIAADLQEDLPGVKGGHAQIHQVMMNLCINAADAMPQGGTIQIVTTSEGQTVKITVTDSGDGIEPSISEKIFKPFFTTKDPEAGMGLGLSVVKTIIDNHNGTIEVTSKKGQGTTFTVYLSAQSAAD